MVKIWRAEDRNPLEQVAHVRGGVSASDESDDRTSSDAWSMCAGIARAAAGKQSRATWPSTEFLHPSQTADTSVVPLTSCSRLLWTATV